MKELSIEEKTERYDKALERARKLQENSNGMILKKWLWDIFPELKESEDEKIRKSLLEYLHTLPNHYAHSGVCAPEWIAWLEKQGKQKSIDDLTQQEAMDIAVAKCFEQGEQNYKIIKDKNYFCVKTHNYAGVEWIKGIKYYASDNYTLVNQGCKYYCPKYSKEEHNNLFEEVKYDGCVENKMSANKVEPKFHEGEWIISDTVDKDYYICKIIGIKDGNYTIESIYGYKGYNQFDVFDTSYKLWTIQDAQDGDVLVTDSGRPFIFKGCLDKDHPNSPVAYCGINSMNEFFVSEGINWWTDKNVYPATKEQRELLFKKMKASGYEWDADKKELKKIEQKSSNNQFTPEQANVLDKHIDKLVEQKQEWSEEDEERINNIISVLNVQVCWDGATGKKENPYQKEINWLKSLKERYTWKPSDEHYELEEFAKIVRGNLTSISKAVQELFEAKYLQLTGNKMYGGFKD